MPETKNINSTDDCTLLQTDAERIKGWCTANFMKLNMNKTRVTVFTRKTKSFISIIKYAKLLQSVRTLSRP
jgi:hypothetical protein